MVKIKRQIQFKAKLCDLLHLEAKTAFQAKTAQKRETKTTFERE